MPGKMKRDGKAGARVIAAALDLVDTVRANQKHNSNDRQYGQYGDNEKIRARCHEAPEQRDPGNDIENLRGLLRLRDAMLTVFGVEAEIGIGIKFGFRLGDLLRVE